MDGQAGPRRSTDELVELSGDPETCLDTPLVEDRETRRPRQRKPFTVFGVSVPRSDPSSALPAIAEILAREHTLPTERVTSCLQRLFEAEFRGQKIIYGKVLWSFRAGLLSILPQALKSMPAEAALELSESEDLNVYYRRVRTSQVLASEFTPLRSLDELGRTLSEFIEHQETNQKSLLETGHPKTHFAKSPWLDAHLNKLYFTKLPIGLRQSGAGEYSPLFYRMYVDKRRIAQRTTGSAPLPFEFMRGTLFSPSPAAPKCRLKWAKCENESWAACWYKDADTLQVLSNADIERLTSLRPTLFRVKRQVITELAAALRERDGSRVLQRCLKILASQLLSEDADFLLRLDIGYAGYDVLKAQPETRPMPLLAGGLTSLLELIGHVKKELEIGTLAKTREALSDVLVPDTWQKPRFVTLVDRSKWDQLANIYIGNPYFDFIAIGQGAAVREGLDLCAELDAEEPAFWSSYRDEVEQALSREFYTLVPVRVKKCFQPKFQPTLQEFADEEAKRLESDEIRDPGAPSPNIFRRMGDDWNIHYAKGPLFAITHLVGLGYIHQLLEKPQQSFSGRDLTAGRQRYEASNTSRSGAGAEQTSVDDSVELTHMDHSGEMMDEKGLEKIRRRMQEIQVDLLDARGQHDEAKIVRLEEETEGLRKYLQNNTDLSGKAKRLQEAEKRARRAVNKAIKEAIDRISQKDSDLAQHLRKSIHTNGFAYEPAANISWETC